MIYYHGGFGRLRVGDFVLPPSITRVTSTASYGAKAVCRMDRVYITSRYASAKEAAAMHPSGRGKIYEVEPVGDLEPDLDALLMPGQEPWSWQCPKARVVRVHRIKGKDIKRIRKALFFEYGLRAG